MRRWNDDLILKYLNPPDKTEPIPLWYFSRVLEAEKIPEVSLFLYIKKSGAPLRGGSQRVKREQDQDLHYIAKKLIYKFDVTMEELISEAIASLPEEQSEPNGNYHPTRLKHICINHLRHKRTNYDTLIKGLCVKEATLFAKNFLFAKVMYSVWKKFPQLEEECREQAREKHAILHLDRLISNLQKEDKWLVPVSKKEHNVPGLSEWTERIILKYQEKVKFLEEIPNKSKKALNTQKYYLSILHKFEEFLKQINKGEAVGISMWVNLFLREKHPDFLRQLLKHNRGEIK